MPIEFGTLPFSDKVPLPPEEVPSLSMGCDVIRSGEPNAKPPGGFVYPRRKSRDQKHTPHTHRNDKTRNLVPSLIFRSTSY